MKEELRFLIIALFLFTILILPVARAQPARELDVKESIGIANQSAILIVAPFDCDSESNVFFMPSAGRELPNSVVRISHDGKTTTRFALQSVPEFEKSQVLAYGVGSPK